MRLTQTQLAAIKALEDKRGHVSPRAFVKAAKSAKSPLHSLIDWDIRASAEHWWLHQARLIIGRVTIQHTTTESIFKGPAYVVDTAMKGQGYRSVAALRQDTANARESLIYTLEVAAGHVRRALDLAAPLGLQAEIDGLLLQIAGVQRLVRPAA